ncbi:Site-specific recombinase XerD [Mycobacterium basiliense]|uniref:Site-specific recombinase XerD n=1 Tax=Mycobacterium basiliense TaxID=2094119 RepID=A0A3S4FP58_9MYCO|nr:Site-specific recombinase XerD [Mycobacterium basiliense]
MPVAPLLADDLREYLTNVHPFSAISTHGYTYRSNAPLFPGRRAGDHFYWAKPVVVDNLYHNYFQPACQAFGLGRVRWYDLRYTFATLALSAGEHSMQVSKWLGPQQLRTDPEHLR